MVRFQLGVIIIAIFIISCGDDVTLEWKSSTFPNIQGTRWEGTDENGGIDFMLFDKLPAKNYWMNLDTESHEYRDVRGSYAYYGHFLSDYSVGTYHVIGDTLFQTVISLESELPGTTIMEVKAYHKRVLKGDRLLLVYSIEKHQGFWRVSELNTSREGLRRRDSRAD